MASLEPEDSIEQLDDEIMFQQTLLASLDNLPDDHEAKRPILNAITRLEQRMEALTAASSGRVVELQQSDREESPSDTASDVSFPPRAFLNNGKRPATSSADDPQAKRMAVDRGSGSSQLGPNQRALQRARLAEEQVARRRQLEANDAALAQSLSQSHGESSSSAAAGYSHGHTFGQPSAPYQGHSQNHSPWSTQIKNEPSFQTRLFSPAVVKPEPRQPAHTPSHPAQSLSHVQPSGSAVVDLTEDSSAEEDSRPPTRPEVVQAATPLKHSYQPPPSFHNGQTTVDLIARRRQIEEQARQMQLQRQIEEQTRQIQHQRWMTSQAQIAQERARLMQRAQQAAQNPPGYTSVYGGGTQLSHMRTEPDIYAPLKNQVNGIVNHMKNAMGHIQQQFTGEISDFGRLLGGGGPGPNSSSRYPHDDFDDDDVFDNTILDPAEIAEDLKNLMDQIRPDEEIPIEDREVDVEGMTVKLKPYQGAGLKWLQAMEEGTNKGGILADDMGLGKTIQAIALMTTRRSPSPSNRTTLIIAPVALLRQWKEEIQNKMTRGRNSFSVFIHHMTQKKKTHAELREFDVILTTFGTIASEMKKRDNFLKRKETDRAATPNASEKCIFIGEDCKWYRVIVDEAQNIKNRSTLSARGACHLQAEFRLCMSGTPMMNSVDELHSLIKFLRIRPYNDWNRFKSEFSRPLRGENREAAMEKLQALLKAILLRRHKKSLVNGKPILILPERTVERTETSFTDEEKDFYKALETQSRTTFNKYVQAGTVGNKYAHILHMLLRLRQACCHPHLVKDFGVAMAADISPETMEKFALEFDAATVERIKSAGSEFECPVCYDAVGNPALFIPCGHNTCADCYVKIKDAASVESGDGTGHAKCPTCRGRIDPKRVIDYEVFKKVHMPPEGLLGAPGSDTETDADETASESETNDSDDETSSETESLDGFIVNDSGDEAFGKSSSRKSNARKVKHDSGIDGDTMENDNDDTSSGNGRSKGKGKGKAVATFFRPGRARAGGLKMSDDEDQETSSDRKGKSRALVTNNADDADDDAGEKRQRRKKRKQKRSKKDKSKSKGKDREQQKKSQHKTLAELKKLSQRNASAKKEYLRRLRRDFVNSAKIQKTIDLLKDIMSETDEKVIVFSQWTSLLDLLEIPIDEQNWIFERYDGSMSARSRADAVDNFKANNPRRNVRLMLVSLKAGNAGLNLTCASRVIILDPFWNPYVEEQAIDRAHRLGQEREVKVHRLLIEETVEDRIMALQDQKREMISTALDEGAGQRLSRLSQRELGYLFGVERAPQ